MRELLEIFETDDYSKCFFKVKADKKRGNLLDKIDIERSLK